MIKKNLELQNIIKIKFTNQDLLKQSLVHKSFNKDFNNEKLEFLGDRVLGLVLSKKLLEIYPNEKEGIIDKKFANLVNKKACALIAKSINIIDYMTLGSSFKSAQKSDQKINSDCLEALIGAIFLDKGLDVSEKIILNLWKEHLKKSNLTEIDSKTRLQEFSLKKYKKLPEYKIYKQTGPQHNPTFKVDVKISNSKWFTGSGNSKKDAQQNAAKKLLSDLRL